MWDARTRGHRLRTGRYSETGRTYLLTTVTAGRVPAFEDLRAARLVVGELRRSVEAELCRSHAWVLMPDHLHWLVSLERATLASLMRTVKSRAAVAINRCVTSGEFRWQPGYHDHALRHDENLVACARYLLMNPVRAGLVRRIWDYPHWDADWL